MSNYKRVTFRWSDTDLVFIDGRILIRRFPEVRIRVRVQLRPIYPQSQVKPIYPCFHYGIWIQLQIQLLGLKGNSNPFPGVLLMFTMSKSSGKPWYVYKMIVQNMLRTHGIKQIFSEKNGFTTLSMEPYALNKSNYLIYTICVHRVLSYHLL